jgi:hypothetical protein
VPVNNWARPNYLLKDSVLGTDSPLERDASTGEAVDSNKNNLEEIKWKQKIARDS